LQPLRSIFAYLKRERENPAKEAVIVPLPTTQPQKKKWIYAAAAAAACLLFATYFALENRQTTQTECVGTFVMIDGICYTDMSIISKYIIEAINLVNIPFEDGYVFDEMDFFDEI